MERVDCIVIGAGVVGLAVARRLAREGREVVVVEAEDAIGTHTSSRNSEVIHAGIYYAPGSLKARLCVPGRQALYAYCDAHGVAHRRCGKLIVAASDEQRPALARLRAQALANGVDDLRELSAAQARAMEPELSCVAALLSPSTGIIDSHAYMLALQGDAEARGAVLALRSPVEAGRAGAGGIELEVGGEQRTRIDARWVVNSAGLHAQRVAASLAGFPAAQVPPCHYAKGNYYTLAGRAPFSRLIYPIPEAAGLGVHLTLDLAGQARFGPTWNGSTPSTTASIRAARTPSTARSAATGRGYPTAPSPRATRGSGRSSRRPASRRATSSSRARGTTESRGW